MTSRVFLVSTTIVSGFFTGFSLANIVYYARLRNAGCSAISSGEATSMLILNIILFIIALVIFIWTIWELIVSSKTKQQLYQYITSPVGSPSPFTTTTGQVEIPAQATTTVPVVEVSPTPAVATVSTKPTTAIPVAVEAGARRYGAYTPVSSSYQKKYS